MRIVLASTSPSRLRILRAAGIEPLVLDSNVDEEALITQAGQITPEQHVQMLASAKARAVLPRLEGFNGLVLGGDSMFVLDGEVFGKPLLPEVAHERWRQMRGRTGTLLTGHCLIDHRRGIAAKEVTAVTGANVTFATEISDSEIAAYVATGEPLFVAGAFTLEGRAAAFIDAVDGDPHTVIGLSVATLRRLAAQLSVPWTELAS